MIEVIPAILESEFAEIERKIIAVEMLVDWVQIDIADNTLVTNTTFLDPAPYTTLKTRLNLEVHLMVKDPLKYLDAYAKAGFKRFYTHIEGVNIEEYIARCFKLGVEVGLAIDGLTPVENIHPYLDNIDAVLVMAIEAGESGRPYREDTENKIRKIREIDFEIPIAVDGAMNDTNALKVISAGATRINSNSYIFSGGNIEERINTLKNLGIPKKLK